MKNKILLSIACLFFSSAVFGQFTFGVSPGFSFNGAYFGYKVNKRVLPFVGIQFGNMSFKFDESGTRENGSGGFEEYHDKFDFKGGIYVINIGAKHYFKPKNKIKAYTALNLVKPILKGKLTTEDAELQKEVNDQIKNIKMWGGEIGFGTEYFFDDNFSIGGEFGIRHLGINVKNTRTETLFDNNGNSKEVEIVTKANTNINPTYTRFSLNFYF